MIMTKLPNDESDYYECRLQNHPFYVQNNPEFTFTRKLSRKSISIKFLNSHYALGLLNILVLHSTLYFLYTSAQYILTTCLSVYSLLMCFYCTVQTFTPYSMNEYCISNVHELRKEKNVSPHLMISDIPRVHPGGVRFCFWEPDHRHICLSSKWLTF